MYNEVLRKIKKVEIQGSTNIAKAGVNALLWKIERIKARNMLAFLKEVKDAARKLMEARPVEPYLRNAIRYITKGISIDVKSTKGEMKKRGKEILTIISKTRKLAQEVVAESVEDGITILTHCHSSNVVGGLILAKEEGKKFEVINTETRPLFQGRKTARELAKAGIKVTHIVDSAAAYVMKDVDLVLVGADLITAEGHLLNKIGTYGIALAADKHDIPLYSVAPMLKYDPTTAYRIFVKTELRGPDEVWKGRPSKVRILNFAFDETPREFITGYITEDGIVTPSTIARKVGEKYGWIFQD